MKDLVMKLIEELLNDKDRLLKLALSAELTPADFSYLAGVSEDDMVRLVGSAVDRESIVNEGQLSNDLRLTLSHRLEAYLRVRKVLATVQMVHKINESNFRRHITL
jgi:hypothetical protein